MNILELPITYSIVGSFDIPMFENIDAPLLEFKYFNYSIRVYNNDNYSIDVYSLETLSGEALKRLEYTIKQKLKEL